MTLNTQTRSLRFSAVMALGLAIAVLSGCASNKPVSSINIADLSSNRTSITSKRPGQVVNQGAVKNQRAGLMQSYAYWKGTPYEWGGEDKGGIDCSGLVQNVYSELYDLDLPRNTQAQLKAGKKIGRDNLNVSDLVFFRTGIRTRHVGIYLGNDRFMHASTSQGVTISSLDNPYWRRHYMTAVRVLPHQR